MTVTISGTSGVTYPAGGTDNVAGAGVGTTDAQTLTNKTITSPTINGTPVMGASIITSGTTQATTSGTFVDFTSVPSWVKRITVMLNTVSTSGTSPYALRAGTSGGIDSTNYDASYQLFNNGTISTFSHVTTYIPAFPTPSATSSVKCNFIFTNITGNIWTVTGTSSDATTLTGFVSATVSLTGTLTTIRLTTANGTDTFDAGSVNIFWE